MPGEGFLRLFRHLFNALMQLVIATGIYPPEIGGPATFVPVLARFLVQEGHTVTVVTYGDAQTMQGEEWKVVVVPRGQSVFWRYVRYAWRVYVCAIYADGVFLQGAVSEGLPGTIGAILASRPRVLRVPGDYAWEQYQQQPGLVQPERLESFVTHVHSGRIRILEWIERWVARRAARVVVPSQYLKSIVRAWGIPDKKIQVVYNDVSPLLPVQTPRQVLRARYGIPENAQVLFSIARAVPWKGIDFLLSLLPALSSMHVLVVAGDGPLLESWKARVQEEGLSSRVIFVGRWPHEALADWFQAADAFVLASAYEGFPHVAVEAAMQGLHSFLSDAGGNPETRDVLPGRTTILPYENREVWLRALSITSFPRHDPFSPVPQMGARVAAILQSVFS